MWPGQGCRPQHRALSRACCRLRACSTFWTPLPQLPGRRRAAEEPALPKIASHAFEGAGLGPSFDLTLSVPHKKPDAAPPEVDMTAFDGSGRQVLCMEFIVPIK
jgi:hypothetical protein